MRRKFSNEYKQEAVELVLSAPGAGVERIAKQLGVGKSTLDKWVSEHKKSEKKDLDINEREELRKLKKELHQVKLERDFLKKATAFFVKNPVE